MGDSKAYRDDDLATNERTADLERRLGTVPPDDASRKTLEAEVAAAWARQFDAEVHRGKIVKVVPRPRWAPRPNSEADRWKKTKQLLVIVVVLGLFALLKWMAG